MKNEKLKMESASFGQSLTPPAKKKQKKDFKKTMKEVNETNCFFIFPPKAFKIAQRAPLPFLIFNFSFLIFNSKRGKP